MSTTIDSARTAPARRGITRTTAVLGTVAVALAANLLLWLIGLAAGGDFTMTVEGARQSVAPGGVVLMTVAPLAVGMTAAVLLSLLWAPILRVAAVIGAVAALGTIAGTVTTDFDGPSMVTLSLMHVVIAAVLVTALEALLRRVR
ncbi:DUF6069 family protein [Tsukamurella sp. 1534]|uniref:DUF6069 family protein n=1 Tax=Tsukamurella sp. 1534 TaxID=1151061 RepID=UPI0002E078D7|nr:DUF6069 family protein [Tsukamurella sp. 1534]